MQKLSPNLEDYIEAIYSIASEKGAAKAKDIAIRLDVTSPSVTGALRSLASKGLVNYKPYDIISLTREGNQIAEDVVKRHDGLFEFLVKVLAVDSGQAEVAACKLEHAVSKDILERLLQFVNFVDTCPLGGAKWIENKGFFCNHKPPLGNCPVCEDSEVANAKVEKT